MTARSRLFRQKNAGWFLALFATLAIAQAVVTALQVAEAIRNSPNASPWLRANADAVGRLAMFESGGRLAIYNDSCCTGVLQMNETNIREYARVSRQEFATWGLQRQVDAWSQLTSDALRARAPRTIAGMSTFDGRPVTGDLVLACVQLGIGNCQRMINAGTCSGFADRNGTTICRMADRIAGTTRPAPPGSADAGRAGSPGSGVSSGGTYIPSADPCIRNADGSCMSLDAAIEQGFQQGSGVSMRDLRAVILAGSVAMVVLISISLMSGLWRNYASGVIDKAELMLYVKKAILVVLVFFTAMSMF